MMYQRLALAIGLAWAVTATPAFAQGDLCQGCLESMCPSGYVYLTPEGDDIAEAPGPQGCQWIGYGNSCWDAMPCNDEEDDGFEAANLDELERAVALGDGERIAALITRFPVSLTFAETRGAVIVTGCGDEVIGYFRVTDAALVSKALVRNSDE